MGETFLDEMKRYIGLTAEDAAILASLRPVLEPHVSAMAEAFYEQIPRHSEAAAVFTGGEAQIGRLKLTLQRWARGLLSGLYDDAYAQERFRIGHRHVQIGLQQRYVLAAMHVVRSFLQDVLEREIPAGDQRRRAQDSLDRILVLDLTLMSETYVEGSLRELKQLNDRLTSTNRALEDASRVKSDFLATMSHELRTPLTSIIGFSRLILDGYVRTAAEQRELTADVHRSALQLLALVDDILDLSRIEADRLELVLEPVDLADLVTEVTASTRVQADHKGLALVEEVRDAVPAGRVDRGRMRQILTNVIGNAIKFTERGHIRISTGAESDGTAIRVDVTDTGIGIAPEQQSVLFERFRQVDASHTRQHGGTGLGLAISKALIERMGGRILLRSEGRGMGTTVTLIVPVAREPALDVPTRQPSEEHQLPLVLLIGQDARSRPDLAAALTSSGYRVREAATIDGVRALARLEAPDLLLIDLTGISAPGEASEWLELVVALHADAATRAIRAVALVERAGDPARTVELNLLPIQPALIERPLEVDGLKRALAGFMQRSRDAPVRVLLVDDDPLVAKFVTGLLPAHEYVIVHAGDGHEALGAISTHPIDVILLDLRMPGKSGYDVIRALKLEGRAPDVPIIVMTNYPTPATAEEQALLSAPLVLEVLSKPAVAARPEVLLERLEAMRSHS